MIFFTLLILSGNMCLLLIMIKIVSLDFFMGAVSKLVSDKEGKERIIL